jgi:ubiquinone/menaquinone biosynthesis C-methylase UbiE
LSHRDADVVRNEYATESRFLRRRAAFATASGPSAIDAVFDAVAEAEPRRVLEVGCGPGELAERIARDLDADVVALDQSERMVELTRARGVHAILGDVHELPFEDGSFDCAVAAWMLYHVDDLDRGVSELARVLRPGGRLVASTNSVRNLGELWQLVVRERTAENITFLSEDAEGWLQPHFRSVDRRDVVGQMTFTREQALDYIENSIGHEHLASRLPAFDEPLAVTRHMTIFVATK